jgi:hypothetical protein
MNLEEKINGIVDDCKKCLSFSFSNENGINFADFQKELLKKTADYIDERRSELVTKTVLMCETKFIVKKESVEKTWDSRDITD